MEETTTEQQPLSYRPGVMAAAATLVAFTVELVLAVYLLIINPGWQSYVLTGSSLALTALAGVVLSRFTRKYPDPVESWTLIGAIWFSANLFALLTTGLWLGLVFTVLLLTISVAACLFDRERSSLPMLLSLAASIPIFLLETVFSPAFRLAFPASFNQLLPFFMVAIAVALLGFLLRQFTLLSLRQKLIISFLILSLLPVISIRYFYDTAFRAGLTEAAQQNLSSVAGQTAALIDEVIDEELEITQILAQLPAFQRFLEVSPEDPAYSVTRQAASNLMYSLDAIHTTDEESDTDSFFLNYFLLNRDGVVVLDTSIPAGEPNPFLETDLSADAIFLNPALIGLPYASPVRVAGEMESARIYFAHRIVNAANEPIGVFVAVYNARFLQVILEENLGLAGEGSYGVLFDDNQIVLAHGEQPNLIFQALEDFSQEKFNDLVAAGRIPPERSEMSVIGFPELAERLRNASREPIFTVSDITAGGVIEQVATARLVNYPWRVGFFQPQHILLAPVRAQAANTLFLAAAIAAVAVAVALLASNQLANPLLALTRAAEEVSAGNLDVQAEVNVQDEVGTLATTFNSMTRQLRQTLSGLEELVAERTAHLAATNEVGRVATSILNPDELIARIVHLISDRFGYYYAAIFLLDEDGEWAVLKDATGDAGAQLKARGHRLEVNGRSMVGSAIRTLQARIALDVGQEAVRFDNPFLPETRSEIALPLIVGDEVLGALDVQSTEEAAFGEEDIDTLQTMANQVAIAIANASLFERTQRAAENQLRMTQFSSRLQRSTDIDTILSTAAREIAALMDASELSIRLVENEISTTNGPNGSKEATGRQDSNGQTAADDSDERTS